MAAPINANCWPNAKDTISSVISKPKFANKAISGKYRLHFCFGFFEGSFK
jgi:hypothetical protein